MLSALQTKKLRRLFSVLDSDHNGQLEQSDYARVVGNLAGAHDWKPGSAEYASVQTLYMTIWGNLKALADANNDGQVSLDEFLDFHSQMLSTPEMYDQITVGTVDLLFEAFDRNRDGQFSSDDFRDFFGAYGISDQAESDQAYGKLDVGGQGHISKDDALERVKEFYFSSDVNAAGNWLFGQYD